MSIQTDAARSPYWTTTGSPNGARTNATPAGIVASDAAGSPARTNCAAKPAACRSMQDFVDAADAALDRVAAAHDDAATTRAAHARLRHLVVVELAGLPRNSRNDSGAGGNGSGGVWRRQAPR